MAWQAAPDDRGQEVLPAMALSQRAHAIFPSHEIISGYNRSIMACNSKPGRGQVRTTPKKTSKPPETTA